MILPNGLANKVTSLKPSGGFWEHLSLAWVHILTKHQNSKRQLGILRATVFFLGKIRATV